MDSQTVTLIGLFCTVIGAIIGFLTFNRNKEKDAKADATKDAVIETKLDNIGQSVDSIRIDLKANDQKWNSLSEMVIRVDESAKQAHKRLDTLEKIGE